MLKAVLSLGAKAMRIDAGDFGNNPPAVAEILAGLVRVTGPYDVIFLGMQAGEYDNGQTGLMVAERLGWPCMTDVTHAGADNELLVVTHQTDGGTETLYVQPPIVLIVGNTPDISLRIPTLKEKLAVKNKEISVCGLDDLQLSRQQLAQEDKRGIGPMFREKTKRQCRLIQGEDMREKAGRLYDIIRTKAMPGEAHS
jgi:electron transfer flavoprotein alpha/beta subunit